MWAIFAPVNPFQIHFIGTQTLVRVNFLLDFGLWTQAIKRAVPPAANQ